MEAFAGFSFGSPATPASTAATNSGSLFGQGSPGGSSTPPPFGSAATPQNPLNFSFGQPSGDSSTQKPSFGLFGQTNLTANSSPAPATATPAVSYPSPTGVDKVPAFSFSGSPAGSAIGSSPGFSFKYGPTSDGNAVGAGSSAPSFTFKSSATSAAPEASVPTFSFSEKAGMTFGSGTLFGGKDSKATETIQSSPSLPQSKPALGTFGTGTKSTSEDTKSGKEATGTPPRVFRANFGSFSTKVGGTSGSSFGTPVLSTAPTSSASNNQSKDSKELLQTNLAKLKGLNKSFMKSIEDMITEDPVINLNESVTTLLTQYSKFRTEVESALSKPPPSGTENKEPASVSPPSATPAPAFSAPQPSATPAKPAFSFSQPLSFSFIPGSTFKAAAENFAKVASDSRPSGGSFSSLGKGGQDTTVVENKGSEEKSSESDGGGKTGNSTKRTSTGLLFGSGSSENGFGKPKSLFASTALPSAPGGSLGFHFGMGSATTPAKAAKDEHSAGTTNTTTQPFKFGLPGSTTRAGFAFGGNSSGASFGVGIGAPPNFGGTVKPASPSKPTEGGDGDVDDDDEPKDEQVDPNKFLRGEGEESEDTLHMVRCKIFRLVDKKWASEGVGHLKVNKDRESGSRRLLFRTDPWGHVKLNVLLFPEMTLKLDKRSLIIGVAEGSKLSTCRVVLKEPAEAEELFGVIEKEKKEKAP
ncbi:hypothetical protein BJ742DRAFT_303394 [Cladochytrium replicatum]|nr:hypothetical protein BJ742DRAFT_303394 [Cladochytrium replicatum]